MSKETPANICFDCKNAVPDDQGHGCPWSRKFEPVPGWTAEHDVMKGSYGQLVDTWRITACPMFDPDGSPEDCRPDKRIRVRCIETGVVYKSVTEAARAVNGNTSPICDAIRRVNGRSYGYHWERVEKDGD